MGSVLPVKAIVVFDIDGVVRDVGQSYRRALADTVEHFTGGAYRPSQDDIDRLKAEGLWNNDWLGSQELIVRYREGQGQGRQGLNSEQLNSEQLDSEQLNYDQIVDFFQRRYRGQNLEDPEQWDGYISQEPLLMQRSYLETLNQAGCAWGFFSGATRGSALYALTQRLGLVDPPLVAMGDAPDKPDPTGLFQVVQQLENTITQTQSSLLPVVYAGDTVADLYTVNHAKIQHPDRLWIAVGVLPPHVQDTPDRQQRYTETLEKAGSNTIVSHIEALTPELIHRLIQSSSSFHKNAR